MEQEKNAAQRTSRSDSTKFKEKISMLYDEIFKVFAVYVGIISCIHKHFLNIFREKSHGSKTQAFGTNFFSYG